MSKAPAPTFAAYGRLDRLSTESLRRLLDRRPAPERGLEQRVARIIGDVRAEGDRALRALAREHDGVELDALEVPSATCRAALDSLDPDLRIALETARDAIDRFHAAQRPVVQDIEVTPGVRLGRRPDPLARVGVYAPGGRAAYASSVLMGVVPARVAGVGTIVVCSPPGPDGSPAAPVLAACALAGAQRVFALGGAGAVAALAFGTESVPRVDKIVGPGNAYVTEAKRQLTDVVATDGPAGPSEVLVIIDAQADPDIAAAELLAQAEHDPDAAAVLVSTDESALERVARALEAALANAPRRAIVEQSLAHRGALLHVDTLDAAIAFANEYAPEHLALMIAQPRAAFAHVRNAGTVFLGDRSSVAFGDYVTGANHVLPTAGLARACSGLSTTDFYRWTTVQQVDADAAARLAGPTVTLAEAEGLPGHAATARLRSSATDAMNSGGPAGSASDDSAVDDSESDDSTVDDSASDDSAADDSARREGRPAVTTGGGSSVDATVAAESAGRARPNVALRPAYARVALYDPGRSPCELDLSDNTSLFGVAPSVRAALEAAPPDVFTRYPTVYAEELKAALAEMAGVSPDNIVTGCGSDDVIDSALRAFCDAGDRVVYPAPTFGVVESFARMNAAQPWPVPLARVPASGGARSVENSGGAGDEARQGRDRASPIEHANPSEHLLLDLDCLIDAHGRVTYLCRPNNPTGTAFDRASVEALLAGAAGIVLIDEAYVDYADDSVLDIALASGRALVLRTMSKAFGLAGLRVGYAIAPKRLAREVEKSRGPYKVSRLAELAALAALRSDMPWVRDNIAEVRRNRARLHDELDARGLHAFPSAANFLLFAVPGSRSSASAGALALKRALHQRGVAVRAFSDLPVIGDAIRVSVGPWSMMERFLAALDACLSERPSG